MLIDNGLLVVLDLKGNAQTLLYRPFINNFSES